MKLQKSMGNYYLYRYDIYNEFYFSLQQIYDLYRGDISYNALVMVGFFFFYSFFFYLLLFHVIFRAYFVFIIPLLTPTEYRHKKKGNKIS